MKQLTFLLLCIISLVPGVSAQSDDVMYVHYINVGQANAALLEFPCGAILIDAGAQDSAAAGHLIQYLNDFFAERKDLNKTLDLVMVTHCHLDHNSVLDKVAQNFRIERYIDNGLRNGSGKANQVWLQDEAEDSGISYANYSFETITKSNNSKGLTNRIIDPIKCESVDPKIILYSGAFDKKPNGWTKGDFEDNGNNHSLFIKVLFGKASFLFIGDGETAEMNTVTDYYDGTGALDADVLLVGHHGAKNATTHAFLDAVTPNYAVISCGQWYDDSTTNNRFNTYHYGHPTDSALNMLAAHIPGNRSRPVTVKAGLRAKTFIDVNVRKRIYATPWDNDIVVRATEDGRYKIFVSTN